MKLITLSLFLLTMIGLSMHGMEKPSQSWKEWLLSHSISLSKKFSSSKSAQKEQKLTDLLPRELREELIKFITNNKTTVRNFWIFNHALYHNFNKATLEGHNQIHENFPIISLACDPKGHRLFSGGLDNVIKIWDLTKNDWIKTLDGHAAYSLAYGHNDNQLYSGSHDGTIKIWDLNTYTCIGTLNGHTRRVTALIHDADHNQLYSSSWDGSIKIWNLTNKYKQCTATLTGHTDSVYALAYDSKSHHLYSGSHDNTIKIWDLNNNTCIDTLTGHTNLVSALAYNHKAKHLYSGSADGTIKVWNIPNKSCITTLQGHRGEISLAYNSQTDQLYSAAQDRTIKIWDLGTYSCLGTLTNHRNPVSLACDPDTYQLYASSVDGLLWGVGSDSDCTIKILQVGNPLLVQELEKANYWQWLALQKAYECTLNGTTLDVQTFALLDHGPANLYALKKIIRKKVTIK